MCIRGKLRPYKSWGLRIDLYDSWAIHWQDFILVVHFNMRVVSLTSCLEAFTNYCNHMQTHDCTRMCLCIQLVYADVSIAVCMCAHFVPHASSSSNWCCPVSPRSNTMWPIRFFNSCTLGFLAGHRKVSKQSKPAVRHVPMHSKACKQCKLAISNVDTCTCVSNASHLYAT